MEQVELHGTNAAVVLIAGVIFVSLLIERLLEVIKSFYDYLEGKHHWHIFWNNKARSLQLKAEELLESESLQNLSEKLGFSRIKVKEIAYEKSITISVETLRAHTIKFSAKGIGIILGILVALTANIDLFHLIDTMINPSTANNSDAGSHVGTQILTGIAMGLGSGPVHKVIATLEKAKQKRKPVK